MEGEEDEEVEAGGVEHGQHPGGGGGGGGGRGVLLLRWKSENRGCARLR